VETNEPVPGMQFLGMDFIEGRVVLREGEEVTIEPGVTPVVLRPGDSFTFTFETTLEG
jgi:hypothetical protein